jgi:DNA-binding NarL/FixJ family response regulator
MDSGAMNNTDDRITVLLVDDHALVREGLREILQMQSDMRVVGEAEDSAATLALAAREQPDIVLLDVEIPGDEVTSTVRRIRECSSQSRVIILSMYEGPQLVQALLTAGIRGYLLKSIHWEELVVAIRAIYADRDRMILGVSRESLGYAPAPSGPSTGTLSARELEVLELVAQALSNGQIASRLHLTEATVKRHLRNIFAKLGAVSRLDAVNKARERQQDQPTGTRRQKIPGAGGLPALGAHFTFAASRVRGGPFIEAGSAEAGRPADLTPFTTAVAPVHAIPRQLAIRRLVVGHSGTRPTS